MSQEFLPQNSLVKVTNETKNITFDGEIPKEK